MDLANARVRHTILVGLEQLSEIDANHLSYPARRFALAILARHR
jgi:hypothetical protein